MTLTTHFPDCRKKFQNKNSIGKTKRKNGSAGRYITRTKAVSKLQVTLKDFRRLCILKGIYPREPKKKFKGGNTTYYFAKDILFLSHEPLLDKFREQKAFLKKVRRAVGRHEKKAAKRLDARRPVYKLDHLIRERYPTFGDGLQDLDDALSLIFLFASLPSSKYVPAARIARCQQLRREFHAYIARTRTLRKVFISIKGIYFQAEVQGTTLTWVEPHAFAQQPTMEVDYRVMLSFMELYEALLTFVQYKLYHDQGLAYPPTLDDTLDASGASLSAVVLQPAPGQLAAAQATQQPKPRLLDENARPLSKEAQRALQKKLAALREAEPMDDASGSGEAADGATEGEEAARQMAEAAEDEAMLVQALPPDLAALRSLFENCVVFLGRETPVATLELLVLNCGGKVGWEGEASPLAATDSSITHQVMDRPQIPGDPIASREYVQPQWVFDCINARALLPTHPFQIGKRCPPHLSPFQDGAEGYVPAERIRQILADVAEGAEGAAGEDDDMEGGEDEEDDEDEDEDEEGEDEDEEDEEEEDDDAREYKRELRAEMSGKSYGGSVAKQSAAKGRSSGKPDAAALQAEEEKELAIMMMPRKKKRLYDRMQHGIKKKEAAADVLRKKREVIDEKATRAKGQWRSGKPPPKKQKVGAKD